MCAASSAPSELMSRFGPYHHFQGADFAGVSSWLVT